jgi:hypothetical protein
MDDDFNTVEACVLFDLASQVAIAFGARVGLAEGARRIAQLQQSREFCVGSLTPRFVSGRGSEGRLVRHAKGYSMTRSSN